MKEMRAIEISKPGGADVLRQVVRSIPRPNRNELLIKVSYAGVNRPDVPKSRVLPATSRCK